MGGMNRDAGVQRALDALGWGATVEIAAALGITSQAVTQWRRIPAERVLDVERITGVPRHELRPDLYPVEAA